MANQYGPHDPRQQPQRPYGQPPHPPTGYPQHQYGPTHTPPGHGYGGPPPPKPGKGPAFWLMAIGAPLVLMAGCVAAFNGGGDTTRSAANRPPVAGFTTPPPFTLTPAPQLTTAPVPQVTVTKTVDAKQPAAAPATSRNTEPKAAEAPPAAEKAILPNVVGMNLQQAQDTMQAAGFYLLNDKDGTGQNRFQVSDRNWVVTRQEPAAGQEVDLATKVTLWAKKYTD